MGLMHAVNSLFLAAVAVKGLMLAGRKVICASGLQSCRLRLAVNELLCGSERINYLQGGSEEVNAVIEGVNT